MTIITIYVTDINGKEYQVRCDSYELDYVGKYPQMLMYEKNKLKACFYIDKICGFEIKR